jgi:ribose transport system permease protein
MRFSFISPLLVIALLIGVALIVLFHLTALGREILAAGANARAAELSGVPVGRVVIVAHTLSGVLAASAGLMLMTRLGAAMPSVGQDWLLPSFLAPVLGGTLLAGGAVSVVGTILGALLVATMRSGLLILQVGNFWLQLFLGLILLFAVMLDRYRGVYIERRSLGRSS